MRYASLAVVVAVLTSCNRDLQLPERPARGSLKGSLDTSAARPARSPEGHTVRLTRADGTTVTQTTAADGAFTFGDLAPGNYLFDVKVSGFLPDLEPGIQVQPGAEVDLGVRRLQPRERSAVVAGRVATVDMAEPSGAQVVFLLQPGNEEIAASTVAHTGVFIESVPPGTYKLRATHPLYVTAQSEALQFDDGQTVSLADPLVLQLNPATVTGSVEREVERSDAGVTRVPAAGVLVTVDPGGQTTTTDARGEFSLGGLSAGRKTLRFALADHHDPVPLHELELVPGGTGALPPVSLLLDRGDLEGRVELADRRPATDVMVSVTGTTYTTQAVPDAVEPWRASFRLVGLPVSAGYEVGVAKDGYARAPRGGQAVVANRVTDVGVIFLTPRAGDFVIDDGDTTNTAGFTRTRAVTLQLSSFTGQAAQWRASESSSFPDAGYQPFSAAQQPFTLGPDDGAHVVYAQYVGTDGVPSPVFSSTVVLDTVAPSAVTLVLNDGDAFTSNASTAQVLLTALDDTSGLSTMRLSESSTVDGLGRLQVVPQSYQRTLSFPRGATSDGPWALFAQVADHAGNVSSVVTDGLVIDTLAPTGVLAIRRGALADTDGLTNDVAVWVDATAAAEPHGGALRLRLANSTSELRNAVFQPFASPGLLRWNLDATGADGPRTVFFELEDSAGNVTAVPQQATITLDRAPPLPAPLAVVGGPLVRSATVTVQVAATDALAGLSPGQGLTLSEDAFFTTAGTVGPMALPPGGTTPFTLSGGDGTRLLYARYRDRAGNDAFSSTQLTVDTTPPSATFTVEGVLGDGSTSSALSATANVTVVLTELGATGQLLGNEALTTCPTSAASYTTIPSDGRTPFTLSGAASPRQVRVCLIDAAGNTLGPLVRTIALDATAPAGCVFTVAGTRADGSAAPAGASARSTITVSTTSCSETPAEWVLSESPVVCTAAGLPWVPYSPGAAWTLLPGDGAHTVQGCVRDAARNVFSPTSAGLTVDSTPPSAVSLVLDNGASWVNLADYQARGNTFRVTATGAATGATEWAVSTTTTFTGFTAFPATSPASFTFGSGGAQRLYAVFRDALGNTSPVVSDDLTFDISPPLVSGLTANLVTSAPDPTFVASDAFGASISPAPPSDATAMYAVQVTPATPCTAATFTGAVARPVAPDVALVAAGGDGAKRLCLAFADPAANLSAPLTLNFTVDSTPPSAPEIVTADALTPLPNNSLFTVSLARPVLETNFLRYERNGGTLSTWTAHPGAQATVAFDFNLVSSAAVENTANVLQLRAVDRAGNVGPTSRVLVTTDVRAPAAPTLNRLGVSNYTGAATVFWAPSTSTDVSHYLFDYGAAPGQYTGATATEGQSPLRVPTSLSQVTLHGLVDGAPVYARMRPVDLAGNVGAPSTEVQLLPNRTSPTLVTEYTVPASVGGLRRLQVAQGLAYTAAPTTACPASSLTVAATDLSALTSPTQTGTLQLGGPSLTQLWTLNVPVTLTLAECSAGAFDVLVDGPWVFVLAGTRLGIYRVLNRGTVTAWATLTLTAPARALSLRGTTLFANGAVISAIDLSKLYDGAATAFDGSELIGTATNTLTAATDSSALLLTRDRAVQLQLSNAPWPYFNVSDATDGNAGTPWTNADQLGVLNTPAPGRSGEGGVVSGNLLYAHTAGTLSTFDLKNLWAGTPNTLPATAVQPLEGTPTAVGRLLLAARDVVTLEGSGAGLFTVDATTGATGPFTVTSSYPFDPGQTALSLASFGPYVLAGSSTGVLRAFELATPRALRAVSVVNRGSAMQVEGAFGVGRNGSVLDLQAGLAPVEQVPQADVDSYPLALTCFAKGAVFEDQLVAVPGGLGELRVIDLSKATDRAAGTTLTLSPLSDGYTVTFPAVQRFHMLEAWGNTLVALEQRTDGVYLELFRASALRDGQAATSLATGDSLGATRVSTLAGAVVHARLALSGHVAFIAMDDSTVVDNAVRAVDFGNLVDDDPSTVGFVDQGSLPIRAAVELAMSGTRLAVLHRPGAAGTEQLALWDVSPALDGAAGTLLSATAALGTLPLASAESVRVYGGYAFVTNSQSASAARTWVVDLSTPAAPRISSVALQAGASVSCSGANGTLRSTNAIEVAGSRLFVSGERRTVVFELE